MRRWLSCTLFLRYLSPKPTRAYLFQYSCFPQFVDQFWRVSGLLIENKYSPWTRPALLCRAESPDALGGRPQASSAPHLAWSFAELDAHVAALARGLLAMGVKKGDRVGVVMGNNRCVLSFSLWV